MLSSSIEMEERLMGECIAGRRLSLRVGSPWSVSVGIGQVQYQRQSFLICERLTKIEDIVRADSVVSLL